MEIISIRTRSVQVFPKFFEKFSSFSKCFRSLRSFETFLKNRSHGDDSFGPKIVEIGAILAIFRPFEIFPKIFTSLACESHRQNYEGIKSTASYDDFKSFEIDALMHGVFLRGYPLKKTPCINASISKDLKSSYEAVDLIPS